MKFISTLIISIISISSLLGQTIALDKKELKQVAKSESKFDSGRTYKAIELLDPILKNHKSNVKVWSLMFKYQMKRFEENQITEKNSLFEQTRIAVNEIYFEDLTKLIALIPSGLIFSSEQCKALLFLISNGNTKSYKSMEGKTHLEMYGSNLKSLHNQNCR